MCVILDNIKRVKSSATDSNPSKSELICRIWIRNIGSDKDPTINFGSFKHFYKKTIILLVYFIIKSFPGKEKKFVYNILKPDPHGVYPLH